MKSPILLVLTLKTLVTSLIGVLLSVAFAASFSISSIFRNLAFVCQWKDTCKEFWDSIPIKYYKVKWRCPIFLYATMFPLVFKSMYD